MSKTPIITTDTLTKDEQICVDDIKLIIGYP